MKADYQLKHQLFGRQGSMWERQVDDETRTRIRSVVKVAGQSTVLSQLDLVAGSALNRGQVLSEDAYFRFDDGNFAVVGQHQRDYHHHTAQLENGLRLHVAYRRSPAVTSGDPLPTSIARITDDFINAINESAGDLSADRDWYLIPVPRNICPIVIEGRNQEEYLVQGIDFIARSGYIALTDSPGDVLPFGMVRVPLAQRSILPPNSFVLSAPSDFRGGRYLSEYAYKSQSLSTFRRAAAEYAGLYVFQAPDVVVSAHRAGSLLWVYTMANAGAVTIDYDHTELQTGQAVDPGYVICKRFDVVSSNGTSTNPQIAAADGWGHLSLDGILPINGLTWEAGTPVELDSVRIDPVEMKPHLRPQFSGDPDKLERFWEFSRLHEQQTKVFLYDQLGAPSLPTSVDFWDLLENFYGKQLVLVLAEPHNAVIDSRLRKFMLEFHPASCNLLLGIKTDLPPGGVESDDYGNPLLDEYGEYVPAGDLISTCDAFYLSYNGISLTYDGSGFSYSVC